MTKSQELLKEIEELRTNYFRELSERRIKIKNIYEKEKIEIERWQKLKEEGKQEKIISPIEMVRELGEEIEEKTAKFDKEVKDKMLSDLSSWALEPEGFFYRVDGKLKTITVDMGTIGEHICDTINFGNHPKSKYRNEIVNAFINEIKQNPQDWKIIKGVEPIINGIPFTYGTHSAIEHKSGRKHYKPDFNQIGSFSSAEWAEIENALKNQKVDNKELVEKKNELQIKEDENKKMIAECDIKGREENNSSNWDEKDKQLEGKKNTANQQISLQNKESNNQNIYYGIGLVSLVLLLISLAVIRMKKKK